MEKCLGIIRLSPSLALSYLAGQRMTMGPAVRFGGIDSRHAQSTNRESSCPDLIGASTTFSAASEGVDGRIKSGHDDRIWVWTSLGSKSLRLGMTVLFESPDDEERHYA
jgi:hypothetical protein